MLDHGAISPDRDHARRPHAFAGADVEHALMEVALDRVAVDESFRQRPGTVRARVVGGVKRAVEVVDRQRQAARFDLPHLADADVLDLAQLHAGRHNPVPVYETPKVGPLAAERGRCSGKNRTIC